MERLIELYGDMLYDFCESVLWSPKNAVIAFKILVRRLRHHFHQGHLYSEYERAWVLKIACEELRSLASKHGRRLSPPEQVMLDASLESDTRLKYFDSYFHRLGLEEQMLLLLRDKYGIPYSEIACAFGLGEESIKTKRQHALRALEEWLWERQ